MKSRMIVERSDGIYKYKYKYKYKSRRIVERLNRIIVSGFYSGRDSIPAAGLDGWV